MARIPLLSLLSLTISLLAAVGISLQNFYLPHHTSTKTSWILQTLLWTFFILALFAAEFCYYVVLQRRQGSEVVRASCIGGIVFFIVALIITHALRLDDWIEVLGAGATTLGQVIGVLVWKGRRTRVVDGRIVVVDDDEEVKEVTPGKALNEDWKSVSKSIDGIWKSVRSSASHLETKLHWRDGRWHPEVGISREFWLDRNGRGRGH